MTLDCIRHPVEEGIGERRRFEHRQDGHEFWGVWDWDRREWRRPPNYARQEAASMSLFLNRQGGAI